MPQLALRTEEQARVARGTAPAAHSAAAVAAMRHPGSTASRQSDPESDFSRGASPETAGTTVDRCLDGLPIGNRYRTACLGQRGNFSETCNHLVRLDPAYRLYGLHRTFFRS